MFRGFTQKKVHSYTLGEQLKNLRGEGRVTLHEVSRETNIPIKYLERIEEGKFDLLPPDVYVKGFLRRYAEFLGVDAKKIIHLYQRERDIKSNISQERNEKPLVKTSKMPRLVVTPKMIAAAAVFLIVTGGFLYIYKEIGRFASVPRLVITSPSGDENVGGNSIAVSGLTDEDARLSINGQPVMVNDKGEFRENILLQEGMNTITISSINRFSKTASKTFNIRSENKAPELAEGESVDANEEGRVIGEQDQKSGRVNVLVRIDSNPTWLSIEADGKLIYSGTMLPGAIQNFEGENEIRVTSGKANQTFIRVNGGTEKKLADDPGIVRDVVFTSND